MTSILVYNACHLSKFMQIYIQPHRKGNLSPLIRSFHSETAYHPTPKKRTFAAFPVITDTCQGGKDIIYYKDHSYADRLNWHRRTPLISKDNISYLISAKSSRSEHQSTGGFAHLFDLEIPNDGAIKAVTEREYRYNVGKEWYEFKIPRTESQMLEMLASGTSPAVKKVLRTGKEIPETSVHTGIYPSLDGISETLMLTFPDNERDVLTAAHFGLETALRIELMQNFQSAIQNPELNTVKDFRESVSTRINQRLNNLAPYRGAHVKQILLESRVHEKIRQLGNLVLGRLNGASHKENLEVLRQKTLENASEIFGIPITSDVLKKNK